MEREKRDASGDRRPRPSSWWPPSLWIGIALAGSIQASVELLGGGGSSDQAPALAGQRLATAIVWLQLVVAAGALWWTAASWRAGRLPSVLRSWRMLRVLAYPWLAAIALCSVLVALGVLDADETLEKRTTLASGFLIAGAILIAIVALRPGRSRLLRATDLVLGNLVLCVVGLELAAVVWSRAFPSPVVWDDESARSRLEAGRQAPGRPYFGFALNSGGYHDEEFFVGGERDFVVGLVADSFGFGVVPHAYNFATVAERTLAAELADRYARVAVHDFGVPSIGMAEYVYLIEHEVLRYEPDVVVVCVFVGNDVMHDALRRHPRKLYSFQRWLFWQIGSRIVTLQREARAVRRLAAIGEAKASEPDVPAYVHDVSLEPPRMTEAAFLEIERDRVEVASTSSRRTRGRFEKLFEGLDYLDRALRERLLVLLIPDEFQVDDGLWETVLAAKSRPGDYDRDAPQAAIVSHCRDRGIEVLDLLPLLRAHVQAGGDRPYHLRDTHWNAVGNRIAGEALGRRLAEWGAGSRK